MKKRNQARDTEVKSIAEKLMEVDDQATRLDWLQEEACFNIAVGLLQLIAYASQP